MDLLLLRQSVQLECAAAQTSRRDSSAKQWGVEFCRRESKGTLARGGVEVFRAKYLHEKIVRNLGINVYIK